MTLAFPTKQNSTPDADFAALADTLGETLRLALKSVTGLVDVSSKHRLSISVSFWSHWNLSICLLSSSDTPFHLKSPMKYQQDYFVYHHQSYKSTSINNYSPTTYLMPHPVMGIFAHFHIVCTSLTSMGFNPHSRQLLSIWISFYALLTIIAFSNVHPTPLMTLFLSTFLVLLKTLLHSNLTSQTTLNATFHFSISQRSSVIGIKTTFHKVIEI